MKNIYFTFFLFPAIIFGQLFTVDLTPKEINRGQFTALSTSIGQISLRDFATSPLTYKGPLFIFNISSEKLHNKRDSKYGIEYNKGIAVNNFNNETASSNINIIGVNYQELFKLPIKSNEEWNFKAGGMLDINTVIRTNEALQNNTLGLEILPTIFASGKVEKDISNKKTKTINLLYYRIIIPPSERKLAYTINLGLLNSNIRNGFSYINQSSVTNNRDYFEGYQFQFPSGFRINTALDYSKVLPNKNRIKYSYVWDANQTDRKNNRLEIASHSFRITYLFNKNNR